MPIRLTPTVKKLLIACFVVFVVQQSGDQFLGTNMMGLFGLSPIAFSRGHAYWQVFTYAFIHHDVMHLFFNMMMLAFIGSEIEIAWGSIRFLKYLAFCSVSAGLLYLLIQAGLAAASLSGFMSSAPMNGSTGAIYGLLMAYGLLFSERVLLFMMLFPMKAKHFIWILVLLELFTTLYSGGGGLASVGHLAGMAAGFVYLWVSASFMVFKRKPVSEFSAKRAKKKRRNQHLKLIVSNNKEFETEDDGKNNPKTWH